MTASPLAPARIDTAELVISLLRRHALPLRQRMHVRVGGWVDDDARFEGLVWNTGKISDTNLTPERLEAFSEQGDGIALLFGGTTDKISFGDLIELWPIADDGSPATLAPASP